MELSSKQHKLEDEGEYERKVLQRLQKVANLPSGFVNNTKRDTDYVVNIFEYLAPKISPELAWTEQMKSRKANGPANVMKTLKACNLEGFLNIIAIKRISSEHNRKKFFNALDLIADIIEYGHLPGPSLARTQKLSEKFNANQSNLCINDEKKENDVPSPFQKKEKLRKETDFEHQGGIFTVDKELVNVIEDIKDGGNNVADENFSSVSQPSEKLCSQQELLMTERNALNYGLEENIALIEGCKKTKSAVPTPFRSSRPREIGESAPVHVISSPSRVFQDFLEKSGFSGKEETNKDNQNMTDMQDQVPKKESHPPRRKYILCKNDLKKLKKVTCVDEKGRQTGQNGKSNTFVEKNENVTIYDVKDSLGGSSLDKENRMETNQQEWTPKKSKQNYSHVVQTSPIVRATDPSRGVNSWMKAQNILEEMIEEVIQIVHCVDISYQVLPTLLKNDTKFLPLIERKLEEFNDSLQKLKSNIEESLQEVNQYLEKSEKSYPQSDITGFIKEITEEYSSPSIQSLPNLQCKLDSLRQKYFQIQSQNALAIVLYVNEADTKLNWSMIEESFLQHEQLESLSEGFLGLKEMLLPMNLIVSSGKRLEKIIYKKSLYKKSAYSVFV
ncbi:hypothetical protein GpartN1_g5086.t1 [Galdieria partita]|uniref:Uncharacterized protein n=1 Tax=Galdieria partita TaxID=83374 RepID=A0A9C7PZJ2_9RHOD|nr:hypothetical protein GpartN1_g5086.t1 [Galdieria partita]